VPEGRGEAAISAELERRRRAAPCCPTSHGKSSATSPTYLRKGTQVNPMGGGGHTANARTFCLTRGLFLSRRLGTKSETSLTTPAS
jgi:hypothetical protein